MARRRPRATGAQFQPRRSAQAPSAAPTQTATGMTSYDARVLAERISGTQQRFRVSAIRLLASGSCGVIVIDSNTGEEHIIDEADRWRHLQAS